MQPASWCSGELGTGDSAVVAAARLVAAAVCDCCLSGTFWKNDSIALAGCFFLLGLLKNLTLALLEDVVFWLVRKVAMPAERSVAGSENLFAERCTDMSGGDLQRTDQHQLRHQPGKQEVF